MRAQSVGSLLLCLSLGGTMIGCGDEPQSSNNDSGVDSIDASPSSGDGGGGADAFVPPLNSHTVQWGPYSVAPGGENTMCVTVRLGNAGQMRVNQIHNVLGSSSHHFIVYRVSDTAEQTTPYECQPFAGTLNPAKGAPLMITQTYEETLTLPEGVAFSLADNQMIRLEMHFVNATDAAVDLVATSTFIPIAEGSFTDEADFLFVGNPDISIPAMSQMTLGPTYIKMPSDLDGINVFALTGHTHQWGLDVNIATTTGAGGADTMVYDPTPFLWDEPETVYHDPGFKIPSGGGFRFSCSWDNGSDQSVGFGEGANDEMCFFWAYYYPSKGARVCVHTDQYGGSGGVDLCCPGNALCALLDNL